MSRTVNSLNRDWLFLREEVADGECVDFDASGWQRVGLPHCFDLPYFRTPEFFVGVGWYRKTFSLSPDEVNNRRAFLEFDGVFQACDVYVNGEDVGGHAGGYTGFSIDITDALRPGENMLAVRVDNNWHAQIAPRAGEHIFSGGIYRDVRLVLTDRVHVPWCGLTITTPVVNKDIATVAAYVLLCNRGGADETVAIEYSIFDPVGAKLLSQTQHVVIAGGSDTSTASSFGIHSPALWHPDHPHLYELRIRILRGGDVIDEVSERFGLRWFEWTADRGYFLNGEHFYLRGANAHQDHAGWGIGITAGACERDVRLMKEAGFNFLRGAHYPHHPAFAAACDRLGMLFWSECVFWGKGGFGAEGYWNASAFPTNLEDSEAFEQSCLDQLREMIAINRNRPSLIAWSMTNEAFFTYHLDRAKSLMQKMVDESRRLDPTRPAAIGGAQRGDVDRIGDIAGYNGDGAQLFINPGVPNMVSEYGAISKPPEAFEPFFGDKQAEQFAWRAGEAIWCGFDYGSIAGRQGLKGIVDHQRVPKMSWHWYRQNYLGIAAPSAKDWARGPAAKLLLSADKSSIRGTDALDDFQIVVAVADSAGAPVRANPPVTLSIVSGPGEFATGRTITFDESTDNKITRGLAAAAMRSYYGGRTVIRATSPGLESATIELETIGEPTWIEGVTPPCSPRPYVPPVLSHAAQQAMSNVVNVALNRPSAAGSAAADYPARLANDGDPQTFWQPSTSDIAGDVWWLVDLEGFYQISGSRITFAGEGNWRFKIETSTDRSAWTLAVDRRETVNTAAARNDIYPPGLLARYWRIALMNAEAIPHFGLVGVEVFGVLAAR